MKKTKLSNFCLLLSLVFGLGACQTNDDINSSVTSLSNYTLSFSFLDESGNASSLPEYAVGYVIGSWDEWNEFKPLTENDEKYSTTFASLDVGIYTYKIVMWYKDEEVDWGEDNCVEITTVNQTLEILASQGDDYINQIYLRLNAELEPPISNEEIIEGILGTISLYHASIFASEINWNAYHYYEYCSNGDGVQSSEFYLTTDDKELTIGSITNKQDGYSTYSFIKDETKYNYYPSEDEYEDRYTTISFNEEYTYAINRDTNEAIARISGYLSDEFSLDAAILDVSKDKNTYTLEISESETQQDTGMTNFTYTYITDKQFNLLGVGYSMENSSESTSYMMEQTTYDEVLYSMKRFNEKAWTSYEENDFNDLLTSIEKDCNYYAETTFMIYQSAECRYSDYINGVYDDYVQIFDKVGYKVFTYVTEDAILFQFKEYAVSGGAYFWSDAALYVNDYENDQTLEYLVDWSRETPNIYKLVLNQTYRGLWQDNIASLYNLFPYRYAFTKGGSFSGFFGDGYSYRIGDQETLDLFIDTTVGNTYMWDGIFQDEGGGYNIYLDDDDLSYITTASATMMSYAKMEAYFNNGGEWFVTDEKQTKVIYQEVDVTYALYLDNVGYTAIPEEYDEYFPY